MVNNEDVRIFFFLFMNMWTLLFSFIREGKAQYLFGYTGSNFVL